MEMKDAAMLDSSTNAASVSVSDDCDKLTLMESELDVSVVQSELHFQQVAAPASQLLLIPTGNCNCDIIVTMISNVFSLLSPEPMCAVCVWLSTVQQRQQLLPTDMSFICE